MSNIELSVKNQALSTLICSLCNRFCTFILDYDGLSCEFIIFRAGFNYEWLWLWTKEKLLTFLSFLSFSLKVFYFEFCIFSLSRLYSTSLSRHSSSYFYSWYFFASIIAFYFCSLVYASEIWSLVFSFYILTWLWQGY